jgi:predicted enzyme related to lactoylglutathione lyase
MGTRTSHPHGTFSWVDLATTDAQAAKSFYSAVFGWQYDDRPVGEGAHYSLAKLEDSTVAAIFDIDPQLTARGVPPHWQSYITVDDVDEMVERARENGATTPCDPFDVMDAGRMGTVIDPTGAPVNFWQPKTSIGAERVNDPGCFGWNELGTRDLARARRFWSDVMGWTYQEENLGGSPYLVIKNGERSNGGMHDISGKVPDAIPAHWNVYFTVESIEKALAAQRRNAGNVIVPPTSIGVGTICVVSDPQGATFTLYQGKIED